MKVKELIKELQKFDSEFEVIYLDGKYCEVTPVNSMDSGYLYRLETIAEYYEFTSKDCLDDEDYDDCNVNCVRLQ